VVGTITVTGAAVFSVFVLFWCFLAPVNTKHLPIISRFSVLWVYFGLFFCQLNMGRGLVAHIVEADTSIPPTVFPPML